MIRDELGDWQVLLVGGTSHAGKSSLARTLVGELNPGNILSTDQLGRHPGRPWPQPKQHVISHYQELSVESLLKEQLTFYQELWPLVENRIRETVASDQRLVIEGSGILPVQALELENSCIRCCWLTSDTDTFQQRIRTSSQYADLPGDHRSLVDRFIGRTLAYDAWLRLQMKQLNRSELLFGDNEPGAG